MRVLIGAAMATVMFCLAVVAAAVGYVIEHAFAIAFGGGVVVAAIVVTRLLARRQQLSGRRRLSRPVVRPPTCPVAPYPDLPHRFQEMPR